MCLHTQAEARFPQGKHVLVASNRGMAQRPARAQGPLTAHCSTVCVPAWAGGCREQLGVPWPLQFLLQVLMVSLQGRMLEYEVPWEAPEPRGPAGWPEEVFFLRPWEKDGVGGGGVRQLSPTPLLSRPKGRELLF